MEIKENGTKLILDVCNSKNEKIDNYSISNGSGLLIELQVSGDIQAFDQVEIGLYTMENVPLCAFGPFVVTQIPVSRFIMTMGLVSVGVYHPEQQSKFAHVSFWTEDNQETGVELNLRETLKFWNKHLPQQSSIQLKMMIVGIRDSERSTFMRNIDVVQLVP